jgi:23S rRNA pseudouridine1911/1915/1917 synthase
MQSWYFFGLPSSFFLFFHQHKGVRNLFEIISEDAELLVINKPAGLVCHPTKGDEWSSLISRARLYLGADSTPRLVNRLDRETSGIVLIAKNSGIAGQLGKLWEKRTVAKEYLTIVHGTVAGGADPLTPLAISFALGKDEASQIAIKDCVRPDGAAARTEYCVERHFHRDGLNFTLLRVWPKTGRKHQIRIHLAAIGHSIVGDKLYGGDEDLYLALVQDRLTEEQRRKLILPNHALHASSVSFWWRGEEKLYQAGPSPFFKDFLSIVGKL